MYDIAIELNCWKCLLAGTGIPGSIHEILCSQYHIWNVNFPSFGALAKMICAIAMATVKFNSSRDGCDYSMLDRRLSTRMRESRTTVTQISDNRVQHWGDDYDNIENEFAVERLKHTNVVQTSDVGLCLSRPTDLLPPAIKAENLLRFSYEMEAPKWNQATVKPSHSSKPNYSPQTRAEIDKQGWQSAETVKQLI